MLNNNNATRCLLFSFLIAIIITIIDSNNSIIPLRATDII